MKKVLIIIFFAILLTLISGFITRQKSSTPLSVDDTGTSYSADNPGGGVAFVTTSEGYPFKYINNENGNLTYKIQYLSLFFNFLVYIILSTLTYLVGRKVISENLRD